MSYRRKVISLLTIMALLISGPGLYAAFTEGVSTQTQNVTTGQGTIEFTGGSLWHTVDSSVSDLVPGDTVTRTLDLHNAATFDMASIRFSVEDSVTNNPFTTSDNGLRLTVERCSIGYTNCFTIYGPDGPPTGDGLMNDIGGPAKSAGGLDYLRFTQKFVGPDTSKSLKGAQAHLTYIFQATQRAGEINLGNPVSNPDPNPATLPISGIDFSATGYTNHSMRLVWPAVTGATSYTVYSGTSGCTTTNTYCDVSSLLPGTAYPFVLTPLNGAQSGVTTTRSFLTLPAAPSYLTYNAVTDHSVSVVWGASQSAATYTVTATPITSPNATPLSCSSSSTSCTISGLNPDTQYKFTVTAYNASGASSGTQLAVTTAPSSPLNFTATSITASTAHLNWTPVSGATSYDVAGGPLCQNATDTGCDLTGLYPGSTYNLTLTATGSTIASTAARLSFTTKPGAPQNFTVNNVEANDASFSWSPVEGAKSYQVDLGNGLICTTSNTICTISGLLAGTTYVANVVASNGTDTGDAASLSFTTVAFSPSGFTVSALTDTSVTLSWDSYPGADQYTVTGLTSSPLTTTSTSLTIPGLTPNTTYTPDLTASVGGQTGTPAELHFTTYNPAPQNIQVDSVTSHTVNLSWDPVANSFSYIVTTPFGTSIVNSISTTISGLTASTQYSFSVQSVNASGPGPSSSTVSALTTPDVPQNFIASVVTGTSLTLSWSAQPNIAHYYVTGDGSCTTTTATSCTFTGLQIGATYNYALTAQNASGSSDPASISVSTLAGVPTNLGITDLTDTTATLSWTAAPGATSYEVSYNGTVVDTASTSVPLTNLAPATNTTVTVTGKNASGTGGSAQLTFLTVPSAPSSITMTGVATTGASFSWSPVSGATSYTMSGPGCFLLSSPSCSIGSLQPGTQYSVYAYAINDAGASAPVSMNFYTLAPAPASVSVTNITNSQATVFWAPSQSATSYKVLGAGSGCTTTSTSCVITGLSVNSNYSLYVVPVNPSGDGEAVGASFSTLPIAPTNFAASSITNTTATLSWDSVNAATSYTVSGDLSGTFSGTSWGLTGLTPNTLYHVSVTANNSLGSSSPTTLSFGTVPTAPGGFTLSAIDNQSASFTWNNATYATSYTLTANGTAYTVTGTSKTITGLTPGTSYTFTLVTNTTLGSSAPSTLTAYTLPSTPTGFAASSVSATGATLSWNAAAGATTYTVTGPNSQSCTTTASTTCTFTGLTPGTAYTYTLVASNPNTSAPSVTASVLTIPAAPASLSSSGITSSSVTLVWAASTGATSYTVTGVGSGCSTGSTSCTISGLTANTSYTAAVVAQNGSGTSTSTSYTFTTAPNAPASLTFSNTTSTSTTATWPAVTGATSYTVTGGNNCTTSSTSCTITGLPSGTTSTLSVVAQNAFATSASTSNSVLTIPAAPTGLVATNVTSNSATISWNAVTGATSYVVTGGNGCTTTSTSCIVTSLTDYVTVVAKNSAGTSAGTSLLVIQTPPAPTGLSASSITDTTATLSWSSIATASSYVVSGAASCSTTNTSCTLTGLVPGAANSVLVAGVNASGQGQSTSLTINTLPSAPTNFAQSAGTSTSLVLSWTAASGDNSYTLTGAGAGCSTASTSCTISGLTAGTSYNLSLKATNSTVGTTSAATTLTAVTAPTTPTAPSISAITATGATISWTAVTGATTYTVSGVTGCTNVVTTSCTATSLAAYTSYSVTVAASNAGGSSAASTATPFKTILATPTNFATGAITATSIVVTWTAVPNATSYTITGGPSNLTGLTGTSRTITSLTAATSYTFTITAVTTAGAQYTSAGAQVSAYTIPSAPSALTTTSGTSNTLTFKWNNVNAGSAQTTYTVQTSPNNSTWTTVDTVLGGTSGTTSDTINSLTPGTTVYIRVFASGAAGTSAASTTLTTAPAPADVTNLASSGTTATQTTLSWTKPTGATGYSITGGPTSPITISSGTTTSTTVYNLSPGVSYTFTVYATDAAGSSNGVSITVAAASANLTSFTASTATKTNGTLDNNGFIYYLGTKGLTQSFANPVNNSALSTIGVSASSAVSGTAPDYLTCRGCGYWNAGSFSGDVYYSFGTTTFIPKGILYEGQPWTPGMYFAGSNDGTTWTTLSTVSTTTGDPTYGSGSYYVDLSSNGQTFKYFMINHDVTDGRSWVAGDTFELYGNWIH